MPSPSAPTPAQILPLPVRPGTDGARDGRARVRLELTRRGRRVVAVLAFLLGLVVAMVGMLVLDVPSALAEGDRTDRVTTVVADGDTLWGFADEHAPDGMSHQQYIAQVRELNHLPTGRVTAGQEIVLPSLEAEHP